MSINNSFQAIVFPVRSISSSPFRSFSHSAIRMLTGERLVDRQTGCGDPFARSVEERKKKRKSVKKKVVGREKETEKSGKGWSSWTTRCGIGLTRPATDTFSVPMLLPSRTLSARVAPYATPTTTIYPSVRFPTPIPVSRIIYIYI